MQIKKMNILFQNAETHHSTEHHEKKSSHEVKKHTIGHTDAKKEVGELDRVSKHIHTERKKIDSKLSQPDNMDFRNDPDIKKHRKVAEKATAIAEKTKEDATKWLENRRPPSEHMKNLAEMLKNIDLPNKNIDTKQWTELLEKKERWQILDEAFSVRMQQDVGKIVKKNPALLDMAKQAVLDENPELKKLPPEKIEELAKQKLAEERKKLLLKKAQQAVLDENPELKKLPPENLKTLAEEHIVKQRKAQLDKKWENGKTIYESILSKNEALQKFDKINPDFTKELIAVYWKDLATAYAKLLKDIPKEDLPDNLKDFNKLAQEKYATTLKKELDGDNKADQEDGSDAKAVSDETIKKQVERNFRDSKSVEAMASASSWWFESKWNAFEAWTMTPEKFNEILNKLPEWKVKQAFENAKPLMWVNEKDKRIKEYLNKHWQNIDPAKTPWCRAFVNAFLDDAWVKTNWSLSARDGAKTIWKEVDSKNLVPGDVVVCERHWKASDGSPGGHIWIFLGMSPNGHPIMLWWNQHNTISVKEEKRNIIAFRQAMSDEEHEKIKQAVSGGENTWTDKKA